MKYYALSETKSKKATVWREIFVDENFRDLKVKVREIIFAIFIFAISNEPTFEFLLE